MYAYIRMSRYICLYSYKLELYFIYPEKQAIIINSKVCGCFILIKAMTARNTGTENYNCCSTSSTSSTVSNIQCSNRQLKNQQHCCYGCTISSCCCNEEANRRGRESSNKPESALPLLQELADLPCTSVQQKLNQYVKIFLPYIFNCKKFQV